MKNKIKVGDYCLWKRETAPYNSFNNSVIEVTNVEVDIISYRYPHNGCISHQKKDFIEKNAILLGTKLSNLYKILYE